MIGCFKFNNARLVTDFKTHSNLLTLDVDKSSSVAIRQLLDDLNEQETYYCEISKPKRKRTLDQNAYMWVLCSRIAEKINSTKDEVYIRFVKDVGQFKIMCVKDIDVEDVTNSWAHLGKGWFCETDISKLDGCTNIFAYKGTSVYTTSEMKRLLDEVITECNELNIPTYVDGYKGE